MIRIGAERKVELNKSKISTKGTKITASTTKIVKLVTITVGRPKIPQNTKVQLTQIQMNSSRVGLPSLPSSFEIKPSHHVLTESTAVEKPSVTFSVVCAAAAYMGVPAASPQVMSESDDVSVFVSYSSVLSPLSVVVPLSVPVSVVSEVVPEFDGVYVSVSVPVVVPVLVSVLVSVFVSGKTYLVRGHTLAS